MNKKIRHMFLISVLILISVGSALSLRAWLHPPLHLQALTLLPESIPMLGQNHKLTLIGDTTSFYLDAALGRWIIFVFGNTACKDTCSLDMRELAQMLRKFSGADADHKPTVIFISLDPENDKPDDLVTYAQSFHPDIQSMTGHSDELSRLAHFFGISDTELREKYSHRVFIIDPQLRYIGSFSEPYSTDALYTDLQQIIAQTWRYHIQR